jgi:hypothetical protein
MSKKVIRKKTHNNQRDVFRYCYRAINILNRNIKFQDSDKGIIVAYIEHTFAYPAGGELFIISLRKISENETEILISSENLTPSILSKKRNERNVQKFLNKLGL